MRKTLIFFGILFVGIFFLCFSEARAASLGDVIITEYMANPFGTDINKEWIELRNVTGMALSLEGWEINDGANHPISGTYIIPSGEVAVVCKSDDLMLNGGVTCDYTANLVFANNGDTIILKDSDEVVIDNVIYLEDDILEGSARYYDTEWLNDELNLYNDNDYGTPGEILGITNPGVSGDLNGNVELTLLNIGVDVNGTSATINFNINADADIVVDYGESVLYGMSVNADVLVGDASVEINNLECDKLYYYQLVVTAGDESVTFDNNFSVTCSGISIDALNMIKSSAKANNDYQDGWSWDFAITVWDETEDMLQMSFNPWLNGAYEIGSAGNMHFSVDNGVTWAEISTDGVYSALIAIDDGDEAVSGTQVEILLEMKVPVGTVVGDYTTQYGIRTQ